VASAAGVTTKEIADLNLELRAQRTPPADPTALAGVQPAGYTVKVPVGKAAVVAQNSAKLRKNDVPLERYVVRFGESLEQIASARGTTVGKLTELNGITQGEIVRGGTMLLVPKASASAAAANANAQAAPAADKPVVVVPADVFVYPDRASGIQGKASFPGEAAFGANAHRQHH
jgi:membrane-bound lytic murein transglycosylase D